MDRLGTVYHGTAKVTAITATGSGVFGRELLDEAMLMGGAIRTVTIVFPRTDEPVHGGTWNVRLMEAEGRISTTAADALVRLLRAQRRLARRKAHG